MAGPWWRGWLRLLLRRPAKRRLLEAVMLEDLLEGVAEAGALGEDVSQVARVEALANAGGDNGSR
jgi:hypothetical protein